MTALLKHPVDTAHPTPSGLVPMHAVLGRLREMAIRTPACPRLDLHQACTLRDQSQEARLSTLLRVMGQALGARPRFLRPGEAARSFDECWLMAVLRATCTGDGSSYDFLICRRIAPDKRRAFSIVISAVAETLTE